MLWRLEQTSGGYAVDLQRLVLAFRGRKKHTLEANTILWRREKNILQMKKQSMEDVDGLSANLGNFGNLSWDVFPYS